MTTSTASLLPPDVSGSSGGRASDRGFRWLLRLVGVGLVALLIGIMAMLLLGSAKTWSTFGLSFLTGMVWDPSNDLYGAFPFIAGTIATSALAMSIAVPVGLLTAIFLSEIAPRRIALPLIFMVELIAAIPSVVIGLWGVGVLSVLLRDVIEVPFVDRFGDVPFFGASAYGSDLLAASLVLALMVTPTIVALTREVFANVPQLERDALVGLGGTRWETIRVVVLPAARSGFIGSCVLALGRAMGETMAVAMVIGNVDQVPSGLFEPAQTISSKVALSWGESTQGLETSSLIALGVVLMAVTVSTVVATRLMIRASRRSGMAA